MILAIDCGSTNHKIALFDPSLTRQAVSSKPITYTVRDGVRAEFDAETIWQETVSQIQIVCQSAKIETSAITTIAITSQAQTFVILDALGRPTGPFISWMDKRAAKESNELDRQFGPEFHRHCSFSSSIPELQLSKLLWLHRRHPNWLTADAKIVSLPSFLAWRIGGLNITDTNLGAMSGLYSCQANAWWEAALEACGARREQLGELGPAGRAVPIRRTCPELRISPEARIILAGNDQTAGAYAHGGGVNQIVLTLGTALVAYRYAGSIAGPYHREGCWGPYPDGGFYELASCSEGCAALDWAASVLTDNDTAEFMKQAQSAASGSALFYPQHMRSVKAWSGSGERASRARATLEGICFTARQLIEVVLHLKLSEAPIAVIGGGSNSAVCLQILSDILDRPVYQGKGTALLGAAMMAHPGVRVPCGPEPEALVEPGPRSVTQYEQLYRVWREGSATFQ